MSGAARMGIVGPLLGRHPGWVPSPGEALADLLAREGEVVPTASAVRHPFARAADTATRMLTWRGRVDLVAVLVFSGKGFTLADLASHIARTWLDVPVVFWLHGGDLPRFAERRPRWVALVLRRGAHVVAPSSYLIEALAPAIGTGSACTVVPNPLTLDRYAFRHRTSVAPRLLWMRTFHAIYQPTMALAALHALRQQHPDARLTMAGQDRGEREAMRARAKALDLEDAVDFPGFLDTAGKQRAFASHDVFLNTNRVDNTPVTVIEAMASGLPVISTNAGGLPHLIDDGRTGLLVDVDDPEAMADAVSGLIAHPERAAALSAAGRATAETCDEAPVTDAWRRLIDSLVPHPRQRARART